MNFDLTGGALFMKTDDQYVKFCDNVTGTAEVEMSADEVPPVVYNLNKTADFSCESGCNDELFTICMDTAPAEWSLEYTVPIKIQARWHKKPRIRKKWLKRYGMKDDIVKVVCKTAAITTCPEDADLVNIEFMTNNIRYILRPDQIRKDIMIEIKW